MFFYITLPFESHLAGTAVGLPHQQIRARLLLEQLATEVNKIVLPNESQQGRRHGS
jgi:hypothetical protein